MSSFGVFWNHPIETAICKWMCQVSGNIWVAVSFFFPPLPGEDSHFDEHIFRMGWFNHQLDISTDMIYSDTLRLASHPSWKRQDSVEISFKEYAMQAELPSMQSFQTSHT